MRRRIKVVAEIPISGNSQSPSSAKLPPPPRVSEIWEENVVPDLHKTLKNLRVLTAEYWDFAEAFVVEFDGECSGMDAAQIVSTVRSFGEKVASRPFVLSVAFDDSTLRVDTVVPIGKL